MDKPSARIPVSIGDLKVIDRWFNNAGEYNTDITVRVVSETRAYLHYTKNQMNNKEHCKEICLTFWDRFWHKKTLEEKVVEEAKKLKAWINEYNDAVIKRKTATKELTERINARI